MLDLINNGTASAAAECPLTHFKSLTLTDALPDSPQVQSQDKRHGRLFEDAFSPTPDPENVSEEDTRKFCKRVHWHDVVEEITLPYHIISQGELKYIRLNDGGKGEPGTEQEDASSTPSNSDVQHGGKVRVVSKGACTSHNCCVRVGVPSTPSTGLSIEHQGRQNRSNSDSRVQQLNKPTVTQARPRGQSCPEEYVSRKVTTPSTESRVVVTCPITRQKAFYRVKRY